MLLSRVNVIAMSVAAHAWECQSIIHPADTSELAPKRDGSARPRLAPLLTPAQ